jgi:hypothetical protein
MSFEFITLSYSHDCTSQFTVTHTHTSVQSCLHCCWLVAASNGGLFPSSGFPNCPWRQPPASNSKQLTLTEPQWFYNSLTDSSIALLLVMDHVEHPLHCCSATIAMETCLFAELLLSNSCCIVAYFAVIAQQRVYMPQYVIYHYILKLCRPSIYLYTSHNMVIPYNIRYV